MPSRPTCSAVTILLLAALTVLAVPGGVAAQEPAPEPELLRACYVPSVGVLYRIGTDDTPDSCRSPQHVEFSWNVEGPQGPAGPPGPPGEDGAGGDITAVMAGSGLTGGGTEGEVTLGHAETSSQPAVDNSGTTVVQDLAVDGFGHATAVSSVDLDAYYLREVDAQRRVSGACPAGQAIRSIDESGAVTCEVDDAGGSGGGVSGWQLVETTATLTADGDPGSSLTVIASCPSGKVAVSGGFRSGTAIDKIHSYPLSGGGGWAVFFDNQATFAGREVTTYAVCVDGA